MKSQESVGLTVSLRTRLPGQAWAARTSGVMSDPWNRRVKIVAFQYSHFRNAHMNFRQASMFMWTVSSLCVQIVSMVTPSSHTLETHKEGI